MTRATDPARRVSASHHPRPRALTRRRVSGTSPRHPIDRNLPLPFTRVPPGRRPGPIRRLLHQPPLHRVPVNILDGCGQGIRVPQVPVVSTTSLPVPIPLPHPDPIQHRRVPRPKTGCFERCHDPVLLGRVAGCHGLLAKPCLWASDRTSCKQAVAPSTANLPLLLVSQSGPGR